MKKNFLAEFHKIEISKNLFEKIIKSSTRYVDIGKKKLNKVYLNNDLINCTKSLWGHSNMKIVWVGDPKKLELKTPVLTGVYRKSEVGTGFEPVYMVLQTIA